MALPTVSDVLAFLGQQAEAGGDPQVQTHLDSTTQMVRAYVRDRGFVNGIPGDDIAAVIVSATARAVRNPSQDTWQRAGSFSHRPGLFDGWTLAEYAVLHRYRRRAL